jgi:hypothetical protein
VDPTRVEVGDIVVTKVAGNVYIHLVKAIEPGSGAFRSVTAGAASTDGPDSTGFTASLFR